MAEDVMRLTQQLDLIQPHILGHSMGGSITQIIAKKYPDKINKIITLNSATKLNTRSVKALGSILQLRKESVSLELLIETSLPWFFSSRYLAIPEHILSFKASVMNNPYPQSIEDQERQFKAIVEFDSSEWLHEIKAETLIITSEEDIVNLPDESQKLKDKISRAELQSVTGGHSSPIEQPNEVCELILTFLD